AKGVEGEIFNIAGENELDVLEITAMNLEAVGKPKSLLNYVTDRPGHDRRYAVDASKLKNATGWAPRVTFPEGLHSTVQWYIQNPEWWRPIKSGEFREYYTKSAGTKS